MRQLTLLIILLAGIGPALRGMSPAVADEVVATVGGEPIYRREVTRLVAAATRGQQVHPAALPLVEAQVLSEIVDRRLVLAYARRTKAAPTPAELDAAMAALKAKLAATGQSLDSFLDSQATDEAGLRRQLAWNLVWEKYLAKYVTEERLAALFEARRREFDGTEVDVSHILLQPQSESRSPAMSELIQQAEGIREAIIAGKISFADAARKYSTAPSATEGGHVGLIPRRGVMDEAFCRAAFALDVGQISRPVRTRFGVHLIRCDGLKPGSKQLADVRKELEEALARELLEKLAQVERQYTRVEFTGAAPYFKPLTRDLVVPQGAGT